MIAKVKLTDKLHEPIPLIAMRGLVLFPNTISQFDIGRERSIKAVEWAAKNDMPVFLVAQKDISVETPQKGDLYDYGVIAYVKQVFRLGNDYIKVLVSCRSRARLRKIVSYDDYVSCLVSKSPVRHIRPEDSEQADALVRSIRKQLEIFFEFYPKMSPEIVMHSFSTGDYEALSDFIAYNLTLDFEDKQEILSCGDSLERLSKLLSIITHENKVLQYEHELEDKVKNEIEQNQRDYFLREQMQVISEELGEGSDDTSAEAEGYTEKIKQLQLSADSEGKLLKEADRLRKMQGNNQEATVIRSYLDYCLELPWNRSTEDNFNLKAARKKLDADHYGLEKVKERIIEMLAVRSATDKLNSQIVCLVGPPGVGKTSIAKSIAECMGRKYVRISLGGIKDESEIRGHRRTYLGSMPGRIITALISAKSNNPLILLDEVDKLGSDYRGDPSAALLEALDPEQNFSFTDHFIDLSFDLSKVLFITTANDPNNIPAPLYDRMEVIELSSYTRVEKFNIAKKHLLLKQMSNHALTPEQLTVSDKALYSIIDDYTSEAGVRELERKIAKLCRKVLTRIKSGLIEREEITDANVGEYLGTPIIKDAVFSRVDQVGVCNGLAWTAVGGVVMPIEVVVYRGSGKLELTGSLGEVMKESAKIALTNAVKLAAKYGVDPEFTKNFDIHIHAPEGAVKKDGPSAGVTLVTALISALSGYEIRSSFAMTGEITLTGAVIPIGGLKEKLIAADKEGLKTVLIPAKNKPDLSDIDEKVLKRLSIKLMHNVEEVLEQALKVPKSRKPVLFTAAAEEQKQTIKS